MFGGYPIILKNFENIVKIKKIFENHNFNIIHIIGNHHKMEVFGNEKFVLPVTESIQKMYLIKIPYFLNFNFKIKRLST